MMMTLFRWIPAAVTIGACAVAVAQQKPDVAPLPSTPPPGATSAPAALPTGAPKTTGLPELSTDGYWIENAPINEIFQYLARSADLQFFFNNDLNDPKYNVTGHLKLTDPNKQMEELALSYGLTVYRQDSTVHLMTDAQLNKLPAEVMSYPLKYLRGAGSSKVSSSADSGGGGGAGGGGGGGGASGGGGGGGAGVADFDKLKAIIKPMLTRDAGQIEFEEKTNTLLVTDNTVKLQKVRDVLEQLDQPKKQIAINVRILRVRKSRGNHVGVDWSAALGGAPGQGTTISTTQSLNALFNLPDTTTLSAGFSTVPNNGQGIVFDSLKVSAIIRALNEKDLITQESCPTIITEDNEQGIISIVDRFPVITSTVTATSAGQSTTDAVRYKIDADDPSSVDKPDKSREIGITLSVTPTLLPDGTVRMRLRPRIANIVELITGKSGNVFPRVSESTVEGISRIPNGQSLFLGGFYDSNEDRGNKKVPLLGSIPLVGNLFSSKSKTAEQISLVFIITPSVYDASNPLQTTTTNKKTRSNSGFNRTNPLGPATPLLPDPSPENGFLPLPEVPNESAPPPQKRSWLGRLFSKSPSDKEVIDTSTSNRQPRR